MLRKRGSRSWTRQGGAARCANLAAFLMAISPAEGAAHRARAEEMLQTHTPSTLRQAITLAMLAFTATEPTEVRRLATESAALADRVEATFPAGMARGQLSRIAGSKTLYLNDPAMAEFEPRRSMSGEVELRAVDDEARELLASDHGSLRPLGDWLSSLA